MKNSLLRQEFSTIIKNKKILIPIIAVLFIPVLYAGMFLWAFWDPYAKMDQIPVAIVNSDNGATLDGKQLTLGDDLVKKLMKSHQFGFKTVDKADAYKQLNNQKYYMLIEIPKDFSKNATTLLDDKPQKLKLIYVPNESYNFLGAQIGGTAAEKIKTAVAEKVTETYAETMFDKITDVADGINKASDGAGKLNEGSNELQKGSKDLNDGLATLAEKSIEFDNGMQTANNGSNKLASGSSELKNGLAKADSSLPALIDGTGKVYAGAQALKEQLPAGIAAGIKKQLTGSVGELDAGVDQFQSQLTSSLSEQIAESTIAQQKAQLEQLAGALIKSGADASIVNGVFAQVQAASPTKDQLQEQIAAQLRPGLDAGFNQFKSGVNQKLLGAAAGLENKINSQTTPYFNELIKGIGAVNSGQKQLQQGIHQLYAGSLELNSGANQLSSGMNQLTAGAGAISSGAGKLADGSGQLMDGTTKLTDGTKELADKLADGAKEASKVHATDKTYDMMAKPVKIDTKKVNHVPNYGTGFTPYFLSLGLFVGALLLTIVFSIREPAVAPTNGFSWFASKFVILAGLGIIQALVADIVILGALDLHVQSVPKFILFTIITSLTFVTLIQFLVTIFADAGRFLAILILILQLTTSAGTFPLETIPDFLQHFNAFLPMTYTVRGFKAVVSSGDYQYMWQNAGVLLIFILICALGTIVLLSMVHKAKYKNAVEN